MSEHHLGTKEAEISVHASKLQQVLEAAEQLEQELGEIKEENSKLKKVMEDALNDSKEEVKVT